MRQDMRDGPTPLDLNVSILRNRHRRCWSTPGSGRTLLAASQPATAKTLKIGLIELLTGPRTPWGYAARTSMMIVADEASAEGGLYLGDTKSNVRLIAYNNHCHAAQAVGTYDRFVSQNGVRFIVIQRSTPSLAAKRRAEQAKLVNPLDEEPASPSSATNCTIDR
ncbi:MAG: ABC transporter substrate-binding protein [Rhodospirillales bacterium]|nr:ABC transporter substrate-binding protein [Rhodospirillales bacterium]